ncbi:hypothetical protein M758_12G138000 [Ceratodon purpureus]|nr:hypothetical protein M758_12G138000 [Ceratodon purpureus]
MRRACEEVDFWDVISTLTQDLTKARNQLARLMKEAKPGGARLYGGDCGRRRPLQPINRNYTPPCTHAGSNLPPNCHRSPPLGHFMCGKQYPHYKNPSPERRRPGSCRAAVTALRTTPFGRCQSSPPPRQRAPRYTCEMPRKRAPWSFEQPHPQSQSAQYSCYQKPEPVNTSCERQDDCESDSNCIKICINPRTRRRRRRTCSDTCRDGDGPARLQGGGKRSHDCLGTQFATLLQDVTCQLRERRLNAAAAVDASSSRTTSSHED